jgi:hypothetical protein
MQVLNTQYSWVDSYLEYNMNNYNLAKLTLLSKRYKIALESYPNRDEFLKSINNEVKNENLHLEYTIDKFFECKNNKNKYKNYPKWLVLIIIKIPTLYNELKIKSKDSGILFNDCETFMEFVDEYYNYEYMIDSMCKY